MFAGPGNSHNAYVYQARSALTLAFPARHDGDPMGALMMNGLTPGPFCSNKNADFVWAALQAVVRPSSALLKPAARPMW